MESFTQFQVSKTLFHILHIFNAGLTHGATGSLSMLAT